MSVGYLLCEIFLMPASLLINIWLTNVMFGGLYFFSGLSFIQLYR